MDITTATRLDHIAVRPSGDLTPEDAAELRGTLLRLATEQPDALVVDLRDVHVEPSALRVLADVADDVAQWPSCPLILLAPPGPVPDRLARLGLTRRLLVLPDPERIEDALPVAHTSHRCRRRLPADLQSPGRARRIVAEALAAWNCPEQVTEATLVVDELVTNAVEHAGTQLDLYLSLRGRRLAVAVGDTSTAPTRPRVAAVTEEGGRGLFLVQSLAHRWGTVSRPGEGKIVWACFLI
jgi:anti-sigma regulatory factor (Ser/Thr protein kinase)/anti-anti-sigma regulatory factor